MRRGRTLMRMAVLVAMGLLLSASSAAADSCSVSATGVSFGAYDVFKNGPTDSTGAMTFECNGGGKPISISLERRSLESYRSLESGGQRLFYNLYLDASRTAVWGDGSLGSQEYFNAKPPTKTPVTVPIYGRIPSGQDVGVGQYDDTVTIVVNF
jgi:spore coat protein U-like protein